MTITWKDFTITATYTGSKPAPWNDNHSQNWNHHWITVSSKETGKKTGFDFWASIANPELRSRYDVLNAFYCFVSDAISGMEDFPDFCAEFGYDEDSRRAEKVWKACKRSLEKLERVSGYPLDEIYDLCNALAEEAA